MADKIKREFTTQVEMTRCKACGFCKEVCVEGVFEQGTQYNEYGYLYMKAVQQDLCSGCLRCLNVCPDFAISVMVR